MGRWTDKPFISQGEWSNAHGDDGGLSFGGKKTGVQSAKEATQGLPLDCCALSLKPFKEPVCTKDGYVFESANIKGYIKEHHKHPFTDAPLETKDLVAPLHYHTNASGQHIDPVSFKPLSRFTKIVANSKSGHVYLWSTVDEFNAKPKAWVDLVTGDPFSEHDLIVLHDPDAPPKSSTAVKKSPSHVEKSSNDEKAKALVASQTTMKKQQQYNAASYSKGLVAASFTSTSMAPVTRNESELIGSEEYMFPRIKNKGYARVSTNLGDLNLELFCHKAPRACYNFIKLSKSGYYKGTGFHRSIKNFMIQGGDPTGTGRGGKSFWGSVFRDDEVSGKKPSHSERGILSMANRGPNTNGSQFFILYRAAKHLDGKHTIFGRVVGGLDVLSKMEAIPTGNDDKPERDIVIENIAVLIDPYDEFSKRLERKIEHEKSSADLAAGKRKRTTEEEDELERETTTWFGTKASSARTDAAAKSMLADSEASTDSSEPPSQNRRGVGKYLKKPRFEAPGPNAAPEGESEQKSKKRAAGYRFGDFSNW
ncbi:cyclophilin peptidyl-prolyl cis-trans isomerase Cyp8 [Coemansia sp. RSA 1813]|nr:cyclophilin peptidyl-prolyl cis-trans isomerase Cyp8 [Coemansia sp. RSA 1646]KAJ1772247.1 cyclophilin peptidyl-prolyl cis-trans isomerase Cyp8 [Coemansia sp. RSA 1843]KAJ2091879.1 cyclophilin peptidyl-prolyl cis-trans isomerase Cyp8 [Coemansia sp. RSA 986]KAJ2215795.1 cyclophilin peptidyl-prolyl cis-trans isomerase Cyp8 [Coemansia sp. RSA 487]KAJ2571725.1 cyclophilin peptidyl-prolyl cis-trans isomerase Cyp8 [Coemansia sp. RSA 1813]